MFKINNQQLYLMDSESIKSFTNSSYKYLSKIFPEYFKIIDKETMIEIIMMGVKKANYYGFDTENQVFRFISLQFLFGFDFDTNYRWATKLLNKLEIESNTKLDSLYNKFEAKFNKN